MCKGSIGKGSMGEAADRELGQVRSFCVFDVRQCQLPRKQDRTKQQSPGRAVHRAPVLRSALHTMNHSVNVNWNYLS